MRARCGLVPSPLSHRRQRLPLLTPPSVQPHQMLRLIVSRNDSMCSLTARSAAAPFLAPAGVDDRKMLIVYPRHVLGVAEGDEPEPQQPFMQTPQDPIKKRIAGTARDRRVKLPVEHHHSLDVAAPDLCRNIVEHRGDVIDLVGRSPLDGQARDHRFIDEASLNIGKCFVE